MKRKPYKIKADCTMSELEEQNALLAKKPQTQEELWLKLQETMARSTRLEHEVSKLKQENKRVELR